MLWWLLLGYVVFSVALSVMLGSAIRLRNRHELPARAEKASATEPVGASVAENAPQKALCPALVTAHQAVAAVI